MAARSQLRASRATAAMAVLAGTLVAGLAPLSFQLLDLVYYQATDPPVILPVLVWPLGAAVVVVGLLFGPVAGAITGTLAQLLAVLVGGADIATTWNWIFIGTVPGFLAGWLPGRFPSAWRPSGRRRFAGAAATGIVALAIGDLPILLDPVLRPGATLAFAVGEYVTVAGPSMLVAALALPLALAAGIALGLVSAMDLDGPPLPARPGWRPFAVALAAAVAVVLAPLYLGPYVREIGPVTAAAAGPAAAPGPGSASGSRRVASVSLGEPLQVDRSCESKGAAHSTPHWATLQVFLHNETSHDLGLRWLDYDGRLDSAAPVSAGSVGNGQWAPGAVFMLVGPDDGCLMIFKVVGVTPITIYLRS